MRYFDVGGNVRAYEYIADPNEEIGQAFKEITEAEAVARANPPKPEAQLLVDIENAIADHIHNVAQSDGWDNYATCAARAGYPNIWQAKALAYVAWVDSCWIYTLTEQNKILAGTRTIPTPAEAVAELPLMEWPV